jgi:hypothetical protein
MGSIISFPILCLANFCCWLESMIIYFEEFLRSCGREATHDHERINLEYGRNGIQDLLRKHFLRHLNRLPVLINGDDIGFLTNEVHYPIWLKCLKKYGFKPSVGKNYVSPRAITLNSELFLLPNLRQTDDLSSSVRVLQNVTYMNVGLLHGPNAGITAVRPSSQTDMPLADFYRLSVLRAENPQRAHARFLFYNKEIISRITRNGFFNLFIPQKLGGLGFEPPHGLQYEVTNVQQRLARAYQADILIRSGKPMKLDLRELPATINFKLDSELFRTTFPYERKQGTVDFLKIFDVPNYFQQPILQSSLPNLYQPGIFRSRLENRNGHYTHPSTKQIGEMLGRQKDFKPFSKDGLLSFDFKAVREVIPLIQESNYRNIHGRKIETRLPPLSLGDIFMGDDDS